MTDLELLFLVLAVVYGWECACWTPRGSVGFVTWRGRRYEIANIAGKWKTSSADRGEMYLRRHWFEIVTGTGERMTLYCERQAKNAKKPKARWWVYSVTR